MRGRSETTRKRRQPAQWLSVQQVADRFRVARVTVWRWIRSGRLTGIRVGRVRRIALEDLRGFTREGEREARARRAKGPRVLGTRFTLSHPLWDLVGKGSGGRANVSGNKYKYAARAVDRR
jgi:excisionase family DNA binding protein